MTETPQKSTRRVTLRDVAARAGVAHTSVSMVLNGAKGGNTGIAAGTRARILEAATELGYQRNGTAAAMREGRSRNVALLTSTNSARSFLPLHLLDGVHDELAAHDLQMIFAKLPDEKLTDEGFVPKILREWSCDGLLIDYNSQIPDKMVELIESYRVPSIWINVKRDSDCVFPDDENGAATATQRLIDLGHENIIYIGHVASPHYSNFDRRQGYQGAMTRAGLKPRVYSSNAESSQGAQIEEIAAWLHASPRPTAVLAYEAGFAQVVYFAAIRLGLRVPGELSLLAISDVRASCMGAVISMALLPFHEVGRAAVQMLRAKIAAPAQTLPPKAIPFGWEAGETIAPA